MNKYFEFKDGVNPKDLEHVNPCLYVLFSFYLAYADRYQLPSALTSIMDKAERVSKTHEEGRALDGRSTGWSNEHIQNFVQLANEKFKDIAAISAKDNVARAVYWHDTGAGPHFHFQCRRNADLSLLIGKF